MKLFRQIFNMQTVRERANREQAENDRALFEAEKSLQHKRQEISYLLKRQRHLAKLVGVSS